MGLYRKKPVVTEAIQVKHSEFNAALPWDKGMFESAPFSECPDWLHDALLSEALVPTDRGGTDYAQWDIKTLEGVMTAQPGDWIIRGIKGELYPCKPDIFDATYDAADDACGPAHEAAA